MIVATAGHIDHGKTALVKALTGVDTDRLPEEKKRGLSIDLGFAYLRLDDGQMLGFVDVPGHERFVRNMLAGVIGVDCVLLVVAADDGPMPQTAEHLAILDLLGVTTGLIAITKIDRVGPARLAEVTRMVEAMVGRTSFQDAEIFPVSAQTSEGVATLRIHLETAARKTAKGAVGGHFRLAIDRSFTIKGAGLVVTGTVHSGRVSVGDRLYLSSRGTVVRVRGIHAQNNEASEAFQGQRCALNISGTGLKKSGIGRGDWLLAEQSAAGGTRLDVRLRVLPDEKPVSKRGLPVVVHLGASAISGRIASIQSEAIVADQSGLARITLDRPIIACWGDRLILRDQSAQRTIAGGRVVDPLAPARGRARPERLAMLAAMEIADPVKSLASLLDQSHAGFHFDGFCRMRNLTAAGSKTVLQNASAKLTEREGVRLAFSTTHWNALCAAIIGALEAYHAASPMTSGPTQTEINERLRRRVSADVLATVLDDLVSDGRIMRSGNRLYMPSFQPQSSEQEGVFTQQILSAFRTVDPNAQSVRELVAKLAVDAQDIRQIFRNAVRQGVIVDISGDRYLLAERMAAFASAARALADTSQDATFTVRMFSDRVGIGRNLAIQVLEYFDRIGLTRRVGDVRQVLRSTD
jgi:selenocysteine-specific elongation factor